MPAPSLHVRVQCLAEVIAALEAGGVIVMKTGRMEGRGFKPDYGMTHAVSVVVDVGQAEAAVPADRDRILADARTKPGGLEGINARVTSTIRASRGCMRAPEIQAAACGDVGALRMEGASREELALWAESAAGGGYVELLRKLLARGAPVDVIPKGDNVTAVMLAAQNGQLAALRLVLAAPGGEAAVNQQDEDGYTALLLAALSGCTAEARLLLERGADPTLADNMGNAPLTNAAKASGDAGRGVAELLLDAKAAVDHQNKDGGTALHFACQNSNVEVARLLLERGANKKLRDKDGDGTQSTSYYLKDAVRKEELLALLARY